MRRALILFSLIVAGEMIFSLPFHVARFFRPTFLDAFNLSNAALGDIFAFYGVVAMLAYFPGGAIADRFSARKLMTVSLIFTALGGFYMAQLPGKVGLTLLFAYWGATSIFLFWAALIKTTREWGGNFNQGRAFGFLDGGRGLVAAGVASLALIVIKFVIPVEMDDVSLLQRQQGLQQVIYFYTFMTLLVAGLVWFTVPDSTDCHSQSTNDYLSNIPRLMKMPVVWLQAIVIICAYCGYKGLDNYGLYAVEVLEMSQMKSAEFMSYAAYLRPLAAICAGYIVDRYFASKIICLAFAIALTSYLLLAALIPNVHIMWIIYANVLITFAAIYSLRGVYFALLEETNTAHHVTGVTVGLVSFIGFTPDIFFAPISGRILDSAQGLVGFQLYFGFLAIFMIAGLVATLILMRYRKLLISSL